LHRCINSYADNFVYKFLKIPADPPANRQATPAGVRDPPVENRCLSRSRSLGLPLLKSNVAE